MSIDLLNDLFNCLLEIISFVCNFIITSILYIQFVIRPLVKYGLLFYIIFFTCYLFYYITVLTKSVINYKNLFYKSTRKRVSFFGLFTMPNLLDMFYYFGVGFCYFLAFLLLILIICIVLIPIYPILEMNWDSCDISDPKFLIALFIFILLTAAMSIYLIFFNS
jgi:hypothetical protein